MGNSSELRLPEARDPQSILKKKALIKTWVC